MEYGNIWESAKCDEAVQDWISRVKQGAKERAREKIRAREAAVQLKTEQRAKEKKKASSVANHAAAVLKNEEEEFSEARSLLQNWVFGNSQCEEDVLSMEEVEKKAVGNSRSHTIASSLEAWGMEDSDEEKEEVNIIMSRLMGKKIKGVKKEKNELARMYRRGEDLLAGENPSRNMDIRHMLVKQRREMRFVEEQKRKARIQEEREIKRKAEELLREERESLQKKAQQQLVEEKVKLRKEINSLREKYKTELRENQQIKETVNSESTEKEETKRIMGKLYKKGGVTAKGAAKAGEITSAAVGYDKHAKAKERREFLQIQKQAEKAKKLAEKKARQEMAAQRQAEEKMRKLNENMSKETSEQSASKQKINLKNSSSVNDSYNTRLLKRSKVEERKAQTRLELLKQLEFAELNDYKTDFICKRRTFNCWLSVCITERTNFTRFTAKQNWKILFRIWKQWKFIYKVKVKERIRVEERQRQVKLKTKDLMASSFYEKRLLNSALGSWIAFTASEKDTKSQMSLNHLKDEKIKRFLEEAEKRRYVASTTAHTDVPNALTASNATNPLPNTQSQRPTSSMPSTKSSGKKTTKLIGFNGMEKRLEMLQQKKMARMEEKKALEEERKKQEMERERAEREAQEKIKMEEAKLKREKELQKKKEEEERVARLNHVKALNAKADSHWQTKMKTGAVRAFKVAIKQKQNNLLKAINFKPRIAFMRWRINVLTQVNNKLQKASQLRDRHTSKKAFQVWLEFAVEREYQGKRAQDHCSTRLEKKALFGWARYTSETVARNRVTEAQNTAVATHHWKNKLLLKIVQGWFRNLPAIHEDNIVEQRKDILRRKVSELLPDYEASNALLV
eukprot:Nk52_evm68s2118 gene=Nk52_evmTU68s2118